MAPKKQTSALDNQFVASIILHTDPTWDSSPIRMPGWFTLLIKDIPAHNPSFDALIKLGYVASSCGVACASVGHAA